MREVARPVGSATARRGFGAVVAVFLASMAAPGLLGGCVAARPTKAASPAQAMADIVEARDEPAVRNLRASIERVLATPNARPAQWGIEAISLDRGDRLYSLNAECLFRPASVLKLLTTAAALERLGADYRFETTLLATGPIENGVLHGDLVVVGNGDPTLTIGTDAHGRDIGSLASWAERLRQAGVASVDGRLIVDDTAFEPAAPPDSWELGDLGAEYASLTTAVAVNSNCCKYSISPGDRVGEPARLTLDPPGAAVENRVTTVAASSASLLSPRWTLDQPSAMRLEGTIAADSPVVEGRIAVASPERFAAERLAEMLGRALPIAGGVALASALPEAERSRWRGESATLLETHRSPPLIDIVAISNKTSHNFAADALLKTLGRAAAGTGSYEAGSRAVEAWTAALAPGGPRPALADGSGLSWHDLVTPRQVVGALLIMARSEAGVAFRESLPIAGLDGSLRNRLRKSPGRGFIYAKTGYLPATRTLAGYVTTQSGERLAFAILTNNYRVPTAVINALHDNLLELLAGFER